LDLEGNDVTKVNDYEKKVFEMMPNLAVLDGKDAQGEEVMSGESDEEDDYGAEEGESDDEDFD